jgi:hypothetical protein
MRALILSLAVAVSWVMLGAAPVHGQSITGLGQADQVLNLCHQPTLITGENCGGHGDHEGGGKGRG